MPKTMPGQVLVEEPEVDNAVKDYLDGTISLDEAAERVPKAKKTTRDYLLKLLLPDAMYRKRQIA